MVGRGPAALAILALAAALRLPNLATNPGWDGDEGYNVNIAANLAHGHGQMYALQFAFVQHPPLFFVLAAALFHFTGATVLAVRLLSVVCSLGIVAALPLLGRELGYREDGRDSGDRGDGARIGLLAALAYAALPLVTLQNRFGYTYNALALWTTVALLAVLRHRRTGALPSLLVAGLATAAALTTDQEGVYLLPVLAFGLGSIPPRRRLGVWGLALGGPALYLGLVAATAPAALLFDATHTAGRVAGGSASVQIALWVASFVHLLRFDPSIPVGLVGLALVPCRGARRVVLGLLGAMLLVVLKVRDPNPFFRAAEPLLPLVCLGLGTLGALAWRGCVGLVARGGVPGRKKLAMTGAVVVVALVPLLAAVSYDARAAAAGFHTPLDPVLPRSTGDAVAMAAWLNERARPTDVILAMPGVSWLFRARTAELLQAVAITGRASAFYPAGIPERRWVYDVHVSAARYLVVDDFTRAWIAENADEGVLVRSVERSWRRVYARGEYRVYENARPEGPESTI